MCVVVRDEPPQTQKKKTTSVIISCWCENFAVNPEKCENSKKMFAFQTGVEIPTPRASLVFNSYVTNYQRVLFRLTQYSSEADEPEEKWHVVSKATLECVLLEAIGLSDAWKNW